LPFSTASALLIAEEGGRAGERPVPAGTTGTTVDFVQKQGKSTSIYGVSQQMRAGDVIYDALWCGGDVGIFAGDDSRVDVTFTHFAKS
jgi:hypothetical protein